MCTRAFHDMMDTVRFRGHQASTVVCHASSSFCATMFDITGHDLLHWRGTWLTTGSISSST